MVTTWDSARHAKTNDFHDEKKGLIHDGDADDNRCRRMVWLLLVMICKHNAKQHIEAPKALWGPRQAYYCPTPRRKLALLYISLPERIDGVVHLPSVHAKRG